MLPPDYVRRPAASSTVAVDRGRLLLLLLEGGQAFLTRARDALARGDMPTFVRDLGRTQDVLLQLSRRLDAPDATDVAARLGRLYEFMVGHLALANAERGLALVDEVQRAYGPIVDAYRELLTHPAPPTS